MEKVKFFSFLAAFCLLASLFAFPAFAASVSVSSVGSCYVGREFNVSIALNAGADIGSWDMTLTYDSRLVEYLSGANSGGAGAVRFVDNNSTAGQTSRQFTARFKAKAIGKVTFQLTVNKLINFNDFSPIAVSGGSCSVTIATPPEASSVNTLSALLVSPGDLNPACRF